MIVWPKQTALGAKDKSEIALNRTKTIKEYVSAPGADFLLPDNIFLRDELGYNDIQIKEIEKARGSLVLSLEDEKTKESANLEETDTEEGE